MVEMARGLGARSLGPQAVQMQMQNRSRRGPDPHRGLAPRVVGGLLSEVAALALLVPEPN